MVCLKRHITPGLLSLEALALCVHPRHPYIGASTDAPIGQVCSRTIAIIIVLTLVHGVEGGSLYAGMGRPLLGSKL